MAGRVGFQEYFTAAAGGIGGMAMGSSSRTVLGAETNQALGLGQFAIDFMSDEAGKRGEPAPEVLERTRLFHTDAMLCGVSALALGTNSPTVLRNEAMQYAV